MVANLTQTRKCLVVHTGDLHLRILHVAQNSISEAHNERMSLQDVRDGMDNEDVPLGSNLIPILVADIECENFGNCCRYIGTNLRLHCTYRPLTPPSPDP